MTNPIHVNAARTRTEADAVAELAERRPATLEVSEREVVLIPRGGGTFDAVSARKFLEPYDTKPMRREGVAILDDLESFIAHAERFKGASSALFASVAPKPILESVIDYHVAGEDTGGERARNGKHRGRYAFPLSDEWSAWTDERLRKLTQLEFAEFLEDRIVDVIAPDKMGSSIADVVARIGVTPALPGRVLEVSRGLTIRQNSKVASHVTLDTGEVRLEYATEHADERGLPIKVPGAFLIGIPVFDRGQPYQVLVRLRYRVIENQVRWILEPHGLDNILAVAFEESCTRARDITGLPLFYGRPE